MDKSMGKGLIIDQEFRELIRPLMKDEYRHLEANLQADGCLEPITVWKGIIVDGHNRYEICTRLGIPFDIRERHFDNREEAIIWICANQLGRRSISEETRRYLIGKRYEAEKIIAAKRNYHGMQQYRQREESADLPYEVIDPNAPKEKNRTSQRIGEEYHLAHGTVEKYGKYSAAIDRIAKKDPSMVPKLLSGRYKLSHDNVVALSHMSPLEVKAFGSKLKTMRKSSVYVPYGVARTQLEQIAPESKPQLQTGIKKMPDYDPDAEITGLTLTIPSWMNSMNRTRAHTDMSSISGNARAKLERALFDLQGSIDELLQAMKE